MLNQYSTIINVVTVILLYLLYYIFSPLSTYIESLVIYIHTEPFYHQSPHNLCKLIILYYTPCTGGGATHCNLRW